MPKRFVSWIAVSSLPQAKKISLEDQLETNREHVKRWNGVMVEELSVPGKSRSISTWEEACATLPAYARLKELIDANAIDVLVFLDNSRLGRKTSLIITLAELCYEAGILLYSTESPPKELTLSKRDLATRLMEIIQSVMAQEEVEKLTRRNELGMKARVMRGDFPGAVPYGWVARHELKEGKPVATVEVDEVAASAIRTIIDLYLRKGLGTRPISVHLGAHGYAAPRGGRWYVNTVVQTLDCIWRYAGFVELNANQASKRPYIRAKSKWPAIISEEDAIAVEKERKHRALGKRAVGSPHRFSGVVWCGTCGKRVAATTGKYKRVDDPHTWIPREKFVCRDVDHIKRHDKAQIAGRYITVAVREAFEELKDDVNQERILDQSGHKADTIRAKIEEVEALAKSKKRALAKADELYLDEKMDLERYTEQINRLNEESNVLMSNLKDLHRDLQEEMFNNRRGERLKEIATVGAEMLECDDIAMANAWLRRHIKAWVYNDQPHNRVRVEYL